MAAVGELREEYGDRAEFVVVGAEETKARQDEIELYGFSEALHGLVVLGPGDEALATLPGHSFGKEEIAAALDGALATIGG